MVYQLAYLAELGLYELTLAECGSVCWSLLEPDEVRALVGVVDDLDPHLEELGLADVCAVVGSVTGRSVEEGLAWPPPVG